MMRRGRGDRSSERSPLPLQAAGAVRSSRSQGFPMGAPNRLRMGAVRADQSLPDVWGMKRSGQPKRKKWAYPELKNAQGTKKNSRHCSGDWL